MKNLAAGRFFELEQKGKEKSRLHRRNEPLMEAPTGKENRRSSPAMPYLATILITLLLAAPAMSVELFRYRGAAKDGGVLLIALG